MADRGEIVDRIYEAAFCPDLWVSVLDSLGQLVNSAGAILAVRRTDGWAEWLASEELCEPMASFVTTDVSLRTEVTSRLLSANHSGFVSELDVFRPEEVPRDPFFGELMHPRGMGSVLATAVVIPNGDLAVFHVQRRRDQGCFSKRSAVKLDALRPHLARASILATRLKLERSRAATEALALLGLPAAILEANGRVLVANELMQGTSSYVLWRARDQLALADASAQKLFEDAVRSLRRKDSPSVKSFPIRSQLKDTPIVGHLIPTPGRARDIFDGAAGIFLLTEVGFNQKPNEHLIRALFDLTPAEARIARSVIEGRTVAEIATIFRVAHETVRTQLKSVLAKTGTHRQSELVAKLGGLSAPPFQGIDRVCCIFHG